MSQFRHDGASIESIVDPRALVIDLNLAHDVALVQFDDLVDLDPVGVATGSGLNVDVETGAVERGWM